VAQGRARGQQGVADLLRPTVLEALPPRPRVARPLRGAMSPRPRGGDDLVGFLPKAERRWRASVGRRDRELPVIVDDALERIHAANRTVGRERHERAQDGGALSGSVTPTMSTCTGPSISPPRRSAAGSPRTRSM
jgi:hypothetical protein